MATITSEEFTRWMNEQQNFRSRLELRMADHNKAVMAGIEDIKDHLAQLNGQTSRNSEHIAILERDFSAMKAEELHIEDIVQSIKNEGCSQYAAHAAILREVGPVEGWSRQKKMAVSGILVGGGALIWPALTEIAKLVHAIIERLGGSQ